jgi:beta-glucanase (GH16 family)
MTKKTSCIKTLSAPLKALLLVLLMTGCSGSQEYKLVWEENFEQDALDESIWNITLDGKGGGNNELQYYRRENISIGKEPQSGTSCLIITARKENYNSQTATSGRIDTGGKLAVQYGKIEARIKLPKTANGLWPAFWMLGTDHPEVGWPRCGEIDILEMGSHKGINNQTQDRLFNGACHWGEDFNHGRYPQFSNYVEHYRSMQDDFHLFTLFWDEDSLRMYLDLDRYPDAEPYFVLPISGDAAENHPSRYYHKPFFIIFNLAVGGNYTEILNIDGITALENGDAHMYIDYIRIYQRGKKNEYFSLKQ